MPVLPIAHAGHWFEGLLYLVPIIIVVVTLYVMNRREEAAEDVDD
jgi:hypothetical protein